MLVFLYCGCVVLCYWNVDEDWEVNFYVECVYVDLVLVIDQVGVVVFVQWFDVVVVFV